MQGKVEITNPATMIFNERGWAGPPIMDNGVAPATVKRYEVVMGRRGH